MCDGSIAQGDHDFPIGVLANHYLAKVALEARTAPRGSVLKISGTDPPCPFCKSALNLTFRILNAEEFRDWIDLDVATFVDQSFALNTRVGFVRNWNENFAAVVLSSQPGHTIEIQRSIEFEKQDVSSGMDTYCITHGALAAHYGGLDSYSLEAGTLQLQLSAKAASALGLPEHLSFPIDDAYVPALKEHLQELLSDEKRSFRNRLIRAASMPMLKRLRARLR
jgi:hypothetical protein